MGKQERRISEVLKLCRSQGTIARTDVEAALGISQATAILLLRKLVENGVLIKQGKGKNIRYFANK